MMRIKICCPLHPGEGGKKFCQCEGRLGRRENKTAIKTICHNKNIAFVLTKSQVDDVMQSRQTKVFNQGQIVYISPIIEEKMRKIIPMSSAR